MESLKFYCAYLYMSVIQQCKMTRLTLKSLTSPRLPSLEFWNLTIQHQYLGCHQQISRTCIHCDIRFEEAHVYAGKKPRRFTDLPELGKNVLIIDNILKLFYNLSIIDQCARFC